MIQKRYIQKFKKKKLKNYIKIMHISSNHVNRCGDLKMARGTFRNQNPKNWRSNGERSTNESSATPKFLKDSLTPAWSGTSESAFRPSKISSNSPSHSTLFYFFQILENKWYKNLAKLKRGALVELQKQSSSYVLTSSYVFSLVDYNK